MLLVMSNHVDGIVVITEAPEQATSRSQLHPDQCGWLQVSGYHRWVAGNTGTAIWKRNYFEHIIRNDESLTRVRQYIVDNSARWDFDRENPFATRLEAKDSWRNGR